MPAPLVRRLGLAGEGADLRLAWALVLLVLALYALGYATHYPRVFTNNDEGRYAAETVAFLETGSIYVPKVHPLTGETERVAPGDYPFGMVALLAPFVGAFGWRGAFFPSFVCLLVAVLATARWLQQERRSPLFALVLLGFPAALVAGRLAMSDAARTAVAALGLWWFFRGIDGRKGWWLASGVLAGAALSLRESAVLPFLLCFAGAPLRRDRGWVWLLVGGLLGTGLHLLGNQLLFGTPFFVRGERFYPFDPDVADRLALYGLGLLVFVPGGLAFGLAYRGRRRPEVVGTVVLFFAFYLFQAYGMSESGTLKRLVTGLRYFAPLLPLLAFAMAESVPRALGALFAWSDARRPAWERAAGALAALWVAGVAAAAFAVHPVLARWSESQAEIRDAIARTVPLDAVMIGNGAAIRKFADEYARSFVILARHALEPGHPEQLAARHERFFVVLLDRSDSDYWRADAERNAAFVARLPGEPELLVDLRPSATDRLRIWEVPGRASAAAREAARR